MLGSKSRNVGEINVPAASLELSWKQESEYKSMTWSYQKLCLSCYPPRSWWSGLETWYPSRDGTTSSYGARERSLISNGSCLFTFWDCSVKYSCIHYNINQHIMIMLKSWIGSICSFISRYKLAHTHTHIQICVHVHK